MDVIELTLLLKSIGFRLESIDFDELRCWSKKSGENVHEVGAAAVSDTNFTHSDEQHFINVEISCSKSKIVSKLSLKFNETDATATDAHKMPSPTNTIACTCPKREPLHDNNSFWEVQSSGTFANPRRLSINALMVSQFVIYTKLNYIDRHILTPMCSHNIDTFYRHVFFNTYFRAVKRESIMTHRQIYYQFYQPNPLH